MPGVAGNAALRCDDGGEEMRGVVIRMSALVRWSVDPLRLETGLIDPRFYGR